MGCSKKWAWNCKRADEEWYKQNTWGDTALIFAAVNVNVAMIKELLNFNANIDLQNPKGYTALMLATEQNSLETVRELLKHGANLDKQNSWGTPALSLAVIMVILIC